jgi:predicted N-acyltransferase
MLADRRRASPPRTCHLRTEPDEVEVLAEAAGFLRRTDQQFHFFNDGYGTYDDFLATLASRKRKALKKERRGPRSPTASPSTG